MSVNRFTVSNSCCYSSLYCLRRGRLEIGDRIPTERLATLSADAFSWPTICFRQTKVLRPSDLIAHRKRKEDLPFYFKLAPGSKSTILQTLWKAWREAN